MGGLRSCRHPGRRVNSSAHVPWGQRALRSGFRFQAAVRDSIRKAALLPSAISHRLSSPSSLAFVLVILKRPLNQAAAPEQASLGAASRGSVDRGKIIPSQRCYCHPVCSYRRIFCIPTVSQCCPQIGTSSIKFETYHSIACYHRPGYSIYSKKNKR